MYHLSLRNHGDFTILFFFANLPHAPTFQLWLVNQTPLECNTPRNRWPFLKSGLINHWVFPTYSIRPATKSLFLGGEGGGGGPVCRLKSQTTRNSIRSRHYLEMPLMRGPRPQYPNYLKSPAVALDLALFGSSRENQWKDASLKRIGCPKKVQVDYFC